MPTLRLTAAIFGIALTMHSFSQNSRQAVDVIIARSDRVSQNEVRFQVQVTNRLKSAVFFSGINYKSGPILDPIYLEHWESSAWATVAPCMDTAPPEVIKLNADETKIIDLVLTIPLPATCKKRNIELVGDFRFRLDYFETEKQAHNYLQNFFGNNQAVPTQIATSDVFHIPPPR
jgi:hypothetical protein